MKLRKIDSLYDLTPRRLSDEVLAAILLGEPPSSVPFLKPEHFPIIRDREIWRAMTELERDGKPIDFVTIDEHLKHTTTLEDNINWAGYLMGIASMASGFVIHTLEDNARTMYEYWRRWQNANAAFALWQDALNLEKPLPPDDITGLPPEQRILTVADILNADIPAPRGPWKGVIPPGLTMLGARPKSGKSLLMLQLATALGCGGMHFGQRVEKTKVLYCTLEDHEGRLQTRLLKIGTPIDASVDFVKKIAPLQSADGLEYIVGLMDSYGLIIIDTIERSMPGLDFTKDGKVYGRVLGELQSASLGRNMSVVGIVHKRKGQVGTWSGDPVDDVMGTTQMTTAADCVLCIYREEPKGERGSSERSGDPRSGAHRARRARLAGRARDLEDIELTMQFDPLTLCWQPVEEEEEEDERREEETEAEKAILKALKGLAKVKASTVANMVGAHRGNTSTRLQKLWKEGKVRMELIDNISYYFLEEPKGEMEGHSV